MLLASILILARQAAPVARLLGSASWALRHPRGALSSVKTLAMWNVLRAALAAATLVCVAGGAYADLSAPQTPEAARAAKQVVEVASPACGLKGRIVLETRGKQKVVQVSGAASNNAQAPEEHAPRNTVARYVESQVALRSVRPEWQRTDDRPISEDPSYRGREFTSSGRLLGRPIHAKLGVELRVRLPEAVEGVRVRVEVKELVVTAHRYRTSWGRVRAIDEKPVEVGHLPAQTLAASSGKTTGRRVFRSVREMHSRVQPGRKDVVRMAGYAFGLTCRYRIVVEGFGKGSQNPLPEATCLLQRHGTSTTITPLQGRAGSPAPAGSFDS